MLFPLNNVLQVMYLEFEMLWKIKLQRIVRNLLDKLWKLYMNETVIKKFLAFLKI